jgi:hypothetical protein
MYKLANGILIGAACLALPTVAAWGQDAGRGGRGRGAQTPPAPPVSEEYLLLGDSTRGAGEPMVAVDPTDPRHIIAVLWEICKCCPDTRLLSRPA